MMGGKTYLVIDHCVAITGPRCYELRRSCTYATHQSKAAASKTSAVWIIDANSTYSSGL